MQHRPSPPFTKQAAVQVVGEIEACWNTGNVREIISGNAPEGIWQRGDEIYQGHAALEFFLNRTWQQELNSQMKLTLYVFTDNKITVGILHEWQQQETMQCLRNSGSENWKFDCYGYMTHREINTEQILIAEHERVLRP